MKATEEKLITKWLDYLAGELDDKEISELRKDLDHYPELREELKGDHLLWENLARIETPDPSPGMDARFGSLLHGYITARAQSTGSNWWPLLYEWLGRSWRLGIASLLIGLLVGWLVLPDRTQHAEIAHLSTEVQEMKKMMMLTLIEQPKAQERIKAVSLVSQFSVADERIIVALERTLNEDPNLNVRLAALESLTGYWDDSKARKALVESISRQDSPLVQVAIADAMLVLREKSSIEELNKLMANEDLDEGVRFKIESTIQKLKQI